MKNLKHHYSIYFLGLLLLSLTFFSCKKETNDFCKTYTGSMIVQENLFLQDTSHYSLDTFYQHPITVILIKNNLFIEIEHYHFNIPIDGQNYNGNYNYDTIGINGYIVLNIEIVDYDSIDLLMIDGQHSSLYHDRTQITFKGTSN